MTKDADFPELVRRFGSPPRVLWLTVGNTSSEALLAVLEAKWSEISDAFERGESIVEVTLR